MVTRVWSEERERFIIDTYGTLSVRDQANRLGLRVNQVRQRRRVLIHRGLIRPIQSKYHTIQRNAQHIIRQINQGVPFGRIAKQYRIQPDSLRDTLKRYYPTFQTRRTYFTSEVAKLFGVTTKVVLFWRKQGWLKYLKEDRFTYIQHQDLKAFLSVREAWPWYRIEKMPMTMWRQRAYLTRKQIGGSWLSTQQVGALLYFSQTHIKELIRDGYIPATKIAGEWRIWSADVEALQEKRRAA